MVKAQNGQLKVWWIPQVPMNPYEKYVNNLHEARLLLDVLAEYDMFQLKNNIKPDYSNAGGLVIWDEGLDADEDGNKWTDWSDSETGMDFDEYCEENNII